MIGIWSRTMKLPLEDPNFHHGLIGLMQTYHHYPRWHRQHSLFHYDVIWPTRRVNHRVGQTMTKRPQVGRKEHAPPNSPKSTKTSQTTTERLVFPCYCPRKSPLPKSLKALGFSAKKSWGFGFSAGLDLADLRRLRAAADGCHAHHRHTLRVDQRGSLRDWKGCGFLVLQWFWWWFWISGLCFFWFWWGFLKLLDGVFSTNRSVFCGWSQPPYGFIFFKGLLE